MGNGSALFAGSSEMAFAGYGRPSRWAAPRQRWAAYDRMSSPRPIAHGGRIVAEKQADSLAEHLNGETNIPVMIDCEPTKGSSPTLANVN